MRRGSSLLSPEGAQAFADEFKRVKGDMSKGVRRVEQRHRAKGGHR